MSKVKVTPIPLYRNIAGKSLFSSKDPLFLEYRRRWKSQPLNFRAGNFPLFIDIEVTNVCNLRCTFCATTYLNSSAQAGLIPAEWVYKILDEGRRNGLYGVKFNDRGEPLLHPELIDFVRYAKSCGLVDVYFNTNAMLLGSGKAEEIIDSGLDRISISIEGVDAEFYERYRINGKFSVLLKNVRHLWQLRQKRKASRPLVRIQSVLLPEIEQTQNSYLKSYKRFWGPYADEIAVIEYKEERAPRIDKKDLAYPWACHQLWQRLVVLSDGTILPCNEDNAGIMSLGNIRTITIRQAWNSPALKELRNKHKRQQSHLLSTCQSCALRATQIKKLIKTPSRV